MEVSAQGNIVKDFTAIKQDLINTGVVNSAALADHTTIGEGNNTTSISWQGKDPNSNIVISTRLVSNEFMSTTGMQLTEGRDFQPADIVEF